MKWSTARRIASASDTGFGAEASTGSEVSAASSCRADTDSGSRYTGIEARTQAATNSGAMRLLPL
ncbi:hypothetical protein [Nocardia sp. NBC_01377]|uniref:hypothetical protein n=1 Tax=Nocardia sp. NBC_01377 TaxID=2903595 RepID=UPI00386F0E6D